MAKFLRMPKPRYANSVFINCPFDDAYLPLFRAAVFTVEYCGFAARSALEVDDAGETRSEKLIRLIRDSRLGIHDISRTESNDKGLPRFNMPYEFGVFVGFKRAGGTKHKSKVLLVLDREKYRYQQFFSDIAGQDIRSHNNRPEILIREVRNWLQNQTDNDLYGWEWIADQFGLFSSEIPRLLAEMHKTEGDLKNYRDYHRLVFDWIEKNA